MASRFSNLWTLMTQYRFEISPESKYDDLMCMLCKKLMVDACQTACGCQYCNKCVCEYVVEGDKYCPGGKDECKEGYLVMKINVMRNIRMNNRISKLRAICPREFCDHETELARMEDHLRVCTIECTVCPYSSLGCDKVRHHKHNDPFIHSEILIDWINNLKNEVDGLKEKLEKSEREIVSVAERCTREMTRMSEEVSSCRRDLTSVKNQVKERSNRITALEKESRDKEARLVALQGELVRDQHAMESRLSAMSLQFEKREAEFAALSQSYASLEINVTTLRARMDKEDQCNTHLSRCLESTNSVFDCVWTVDKLSKRRQTIFGKEFYSRKYKLCLSMEVNTAGILLTCYVMRGVNDDKVEWPMKHAVVLSVLDQKTELPYRSDSFQYDSYNYLYKSAFDRPLAYSNESYIGGSSMIRYSTFKDRDSVIVNDSILVACALRDVHC